MVDREDDRLGLDRAHPGGISAAEGEDGLVGIAREEGGGRAAPQDADQLHLLGIEILGVVDDEMAHALPLGGEELGIGGERIERRGDQLGGIQGRGRGLRCAPPRRAPQQRDLLVAAEEPPGGRPFRHLVARTELGQLLRPEAALGGAQQQLPQLGREARHRKRRLDAVRPPRAGDHAFDLTAQQIADQRILLGPREQPRGRIAVARGVQPQHAERVGMDGAHECLAARGPLPDAQANQPLAQLSRRPPAPDQHERAGRILARRYPLGGGGEQESGLARARPADDPQRPSRVGEHAERRRIPDRLHFGRLGAAHERGSERCGHGRDATTTL